MLTGGGTFKIGQGSEESVSVGLDTKGQEIVKIDRDNRAVLGSYFTYADGRLTLTKEYIKNLATKAGTYKFTVTTDGGTVDFTIVVGEENGSGCGSIVAGIGALLSLTTVCGVALSRVKKRKNK